MAYDWIERLHSHRKELDLLEIKLFVHRVTEKDFLPEYPFHYNRLPIDMEKQQKTGK